MPKNKHFLLRDVTSQRGKKEISVKNKFFTRQICAYAQIRRFWQEWRFI